MFANPDEEDEPRMAAVNDNNDSTRYLKTKMPEALFFDLDGTLTDTHAIRITNGYVVTITATFGVLAGVDGGPAFDENLRASRRRFRRFPGCLREFTGP